MAAGSALTAPAATIQRFKLADELPAPY